MTRIYQSIRPSLKSCWSDLSFYLLLSVVSVLEPFPLWEPQVDVSLPVWPSLSLSAESFPLEWASVSSEWDGWGTAEMSSRGQRGRLWLGRQPSIIPGEASDALFPLTRLMPRLSGVWNMSLLIVTQNCCVLCIWTRKEFLTKNNCCPKNGHGRETRRCRIVISYLSKNELFFKAQKLWRCLVGNNNKKVCHFSRQKDMQVMIYNINLGTYKTIRWYIYKGSWTFFSQRTLDWWRL